MTPDEAMAAADELERAADELEARDTEEHRRFDDALAMLRQIVATQRRRRVDT